MLKVKNKPINYGRSSFRTMIEKNYRYIDKTESIYKLISSPIDCAFLSRPRRFGKTLFVDTLAEIFQGNKELFEGLAIYNTDYDWFKYPVISLSLSNCSVRTQEELDRKLRIAVCDAAKKHGVNIEGNGYVTSDEYLSGLIQALSTKCGTNVVVLIDEYDYPIIGNMDLESSLLHDLLKTLRGFYSVIKNLDKYIHFVFLTGVTRIAKTSIFSGMNNLKDISFDPEFSDILGYSQEDIETYFSREIDDGASSLGISRKEYISQVKEWYDGYRFSKKELRVYNPADINLFFGSSSDFISYWVNTGTPSFLVHILSKVSKIDLDSDLSYPRSAEFFLSVLDLDDLEDQDNLILLLYQAGYLTVKDYSSDTNQYLLSIPNKEVELAFKSYIIEGLCGKKYNYFDKYKSIGLCLVNNDIDGFLNGIVKLFKSMTRTFQKYHENAVELVIALILKMAGGSKVFEQYHCGDGVADIVVENKDSVYIIELKMDSDASVALNQIEEKRYMDKFLNDSNYDNYKIIGIGISFSSLDCQVLDKGFKEYYR